jgi:CheY-like chemotaxis protein
MAIRDLPTPAFPEIIIRLLQLLQTKRSDQNFKIIVTVRDYALDEVREICRSVGCDEIVIVPFSDEEIKKFI